jgi:hypothetical protein
MAIDTSTPYAAAPAPVRRLDELSREEWRVALGRAQSGGG